MNIMKDMSSNPRFKITLRNKNCEQIELIYILHSSLSAQIWLQCILQAQKESQIEYCEFYNFPGFSDHQLDVLIPRFETALNELKKTLPAMASSELNKSTEDELQKSLNKLHMHFAHNHLIENSITEENRHAWHEFNMLIHKIESALVAKNNKASLLGLAAIEFNWKNNFKIPIPEECYSDFSLAKRFGSIQISYSQVGRNLLEIWSAQDHDVPLEHIRPARFFSANSTLWFGPDINEDIQATNTQIIKDWFMKHEQKFNAAGVYWERPEKALGTVNVAQLERKFNTSQEKKCFQYVISKFTEVYSVSLEDN